MSVLIRRMLSACNKLLLYPAVIVLLFIGSSLRAQEIQENKFASADHGNVLVIAGIPQDNSPRYGIKKSTWKEVEGSLALLKETGVNAIFIWAPYEHTVPGMGSPNTIIADTETGQVSLKVMHSKHIKNYLKPDPERGSEDEFLHMIGAAHSLGMKVIAQLQVTVANSGDFIYQRHPEWILKSIYNKPAVFWPWEFAGYGYVVNKAHPGLINYVTEVIIPHWVKIWGLDGIYLDSSGMAYCDLRVRDLIKKNGSVKGYECLTPVDGYFSPEPLVNAMKRKIGELSKEQGRTILFPAETSPKALCDMPQGAIIKSLKGEMSLLGYALRDPGVDRTLAKKHDFVMNYNFRNVLQNIYEGGPMAYSGNYSKYFKLESDLDARYTQTARFVNMWVDQAKFLELLKPDVANCYITLDLTAPGNIIWIGIYQIAPQGWVSEKIFGYKTDILKKWYKDLISIKQKYPALRSENIEDALLSPGVPRLIAYNRWLDNESVTVVVNAGAEAVTCKVKTRFEGDGSTAMDLLYNDKFNGDLSALEVHMPAYSSRIIVIEGSSPGSGKRMFLNKEKAMQGLSQSKVACVYESIADDFSRIRDINTIADLISETKTEYIHRGFYRYTSEFELNSRAGGSVSGFYARLKSDIGTIKNKNPNTIFGGAVVACEMSPVEYDPMIDEIISREKTWEMALDPRKYGFEMTKRELYELSSKYAGRDLCFPDIIGPDFQKLFLNVVKKQIDSGVDAVWIDGLSTQAHLFARLSGYNMRHPSVKLCFDAINKIVDEIHMYGDSKDRYVLVGSWDVTSDWRNPEAVYSFILPKLDFITESISNDEIKNKMPDEIRWKNRIKEIKEKYGNVPIIGVIDWGFETDTPLGAFSQALSKDEARRALYNFDAFFKKEGILFAYPLHGGWMGWKAKIGSFGKTRIYDSLAPEFDTYETIKKLAEEKIGPGAVERKNTQPQKDQGNWVREGIIYRTHPVFYPRHSYKEITREVPSLKELGVKTILLAPIWENFKGSNPDAGPASLSYWPLSYYRLNPAYGTQEDLKELISVIHKNDMQVLFDLVTAVAPPGSDWYEYGTFRVPLEELKKKYQLEYEQRDEFSVAYYNRHQMPTTAISGEEGYDIIGIIYKNKNLVLAAWPNPKIGIATDRRNPKVIEYFENVVEYCLKEYDVDGFRIDCPSDVWNKLLFPEDHTIFDMLDKLKAKAIQIKPDSIFQAEGISKSTYEPNRSTDQTCEISSEVTLIQFFSYFSAQFADSEKFVASVKRIIDNPYGRLRRWQLENLNTPRVNRQLELAKFPPESVRPFIVMMSTLPGVPKIVAGQEIGETQVGGRWGTGNNEFFTLKPEVEWEKGDERLRDFYKKVFKVRNSQPALKYGGAGSISNIWKSGDNIYAYRRSYESESVIVAVNLSNRQTVSTLDVSILLKGKGTVLYDELNNEKFTVSDPGNFRISVPAYGARILTRKDAADRL